MVPNKEGLSWPRVYNETLNDFMEKQIEQICKSGVNLICHPQQYKVLKQM